MLNSFHREAELHAERAEAALRGKRLDEAKAHYSAAADAERRFLQDVSPEKQRTFSAIALSVIALLFKAERFADVAQEGYTFLASNALNSEARDEIRELISSANDNAELIASGIHYSGSRIELALSGGSVGFGSADLGAVLEQLQGQYAIACRVTEWKLGLPLRLAGAPSPEIEAFAGARVAQATAGSYRIAIDFSEPQPTLFPEFELRHRLVEEIARTAFGVFYSTFLEDIHALRSLLPDDGYLKAILRIIRGLIPDGKRIGSIEVREETQAAKRSVSFTRRHRAAVVAALSALEPRTTQDVIVSHGTLRAVNLDERAIEVSSAGSSKRFIARGEIVLDDIVGPMVNRFVVVRAIRRQRFNELLDIELDEVSSEE